MQKKRKETEKESVMNGPDNLSRKGKEKGRKGKFLALVE